MARYPWSQQKKTSHRGCVRAVYFCNIGNIIWLRISCGSKLADDQFSCLFQNVSVVEFLRSSGRLMTRRKWKLLMFACAFTHGRYCTRLRAAFNLHKPLMSSGNKRMTTDVLQSSFVWYRDGNVVLQNDFGLAEYRANNIRIGWFKYSVNGALCHLGCPESPEIIRKGWYRGHTSFP
jgi:hypothetical protein